MTHTCIECGQLRIATSDRFCGACGAPLYQGPAAPTTRYYPIGLINTCRFLAAGCMFSGLLAIMTFGTDSAPGRILIVASVTVALLGQLFVTQASKTSPEPWVGLLLPCFAIGVATLPMLWLILWGQR